MSNRQKHTHIFRIIFDNMIIKLETAFNERGQASVFRSIHRTDRG